MKKETKEALYKIIPASLIEALYSDNGITATEANALANNAATKLNSIVSTTNRSDSTYQTKETTVFATGNIPDRVKINGRQKVSEEIIKDAYEEAQSGTMGRIAVNYKKTVLLTRINQLKEQNKLGPLLGMTPPPNNVPVPIYPKSVLVTGSHLSVQTYFDNLENSEKEGDQMITDLVPEVFEEFTPAEILDGLKNSIKAAFLGKLINAEDSFISRLQAIPASDWDFLSKTEINYIIETCKVPLYTPEEAEKLVEFVQKEYREAQKRYNALLAKIKDKATTLQSEYNKEFLRAQQERLVKVQEFQAALNIYNTEVNNVYEELVKAVQTIKIANFGE